MSEKLEEKVIESLIDLLHPKGDVLQIHEKSGSAAAQIQKHPIKRHVVIEPDPLQAAKIAKYPQITVIAKSWKLAQEGLGVFDTIVLDRSYEDLASPNMEQKQGLAASALSKEKEIMEMVQRELPQLFEMKYSDEDLHAFCIEMKQLQPARLSVFLHQLKQQGQISQAQYDKVIKEHGLKKEEAALLPVQFSPKEDLIFQVLVSCLELHMKTGSRFACLLNGSNLENPSFFNEVITNPLIDYQEKRINDPSGRQKAFLAMIVTKRG